jgi:heme-degrading monooxygenase HmoA
MTTPTLRPQPAPPTAVRYVIVFRSRLRPGVEDEYEPRARELAAIVSTMPGLLSAKDFVADDGERVAIIEFDSAEHLRHWREHPDHQRAQLEGRTRWYSSYQIQICTIERASAFDEAAQTWTRSPW